MAQEALLSRINELPRIQKVLQDLLNMVNEDEVDFEQLSKKISTDQVLSARLLRMANSAHFGGNTPVSSVHQALLRVGTGPIRTLVVASVLSSAFPKVETLDLNQYWIDTFEVSVIASKIAEQMKADPHEVFTTGILHNIGELMIHTLVPEAAVQIATRAQNGEDAISVQEELLNISAPALGAKLAKSWHFPAPMVDAIANFHEPRDAELSPQMATTIHLARTINRDWDELITDESKMRYINEHPDSRLLQIPADFAATIDKFRGSGRELAAQLNAA
ncbi:HDOD domain-containing protein [Vibrio aquimaris]|uniref:HDOD domain protein n=1 Tax=Vibrio aquimaris TaxID=2587862 RepID=A0A5P9CQ65_9VIBR|nr:HDOD domain-containing protein [Vibrio aquimaris]QFT28364.1 HDOD domain protein [Vibrio aquimaris]